MHQSFQLLDIRMHVTKCRKIHYRFAPMCHIKVSSAQHLKRLVISFVEHHNLHFWKQRCNSLRLLDNELMQDQN